MPSGSLLVALELGVELDFTQVVELASSSPLFTCLMSCIAWALFLSFFAASKYACVLHDSDPQMLQVLRMTHNLLQLLRTPLCPRCALLNIPVASSLPRRALFVIGQGLRSSCPRQVHVLHVCLHVQFILAGDYFVSFQLSHRVY